jgi:hypothetical protein
MDAAIARFKALEQVPCENMALRTIILLMCDSERAGLGQ